MKTLLFLATCFLVQSAGDVQMFTERIELLKVHNQIVAREEGNRC